MAWYVYITEMCENAARKHSITQKLNQFKNEVEKLQQSSLARFCQFPTPYLVKKQFAGYEGRLIASRKDLLVDDEEHTVIIFLDYMTRGDGDYENKTGFGHDPEGYGKTHYNGGDFSEDILQSYIRERTIKEPVQEMPSPSQEELGFLYAPLQRDDLGCMIYESVEWSSAVNREEYRGSLRSIAEKISINQDTRFSVYNNCEVLQYSFKDLDIRFLAGIGSPAQIDKLQEEYKHFFEQSSNLLDDISKKSCHAYPELLLADFTLWESIETNNTGNMALSPEEGRLLDDVRKKHSGAFPLFINGRAGSGKSTILQYLFTDYLDYYLRENLASHSNINPPLYLTCNDRLLERAKNSVLQFLLCSNTQTSDTPYEKETLSANSVFTNAFQPFYSYLRKQIPKSEQRFFAPKAHIKYSKFVELWDDRFKEPIDVTPEVAWHVIRTFIKGNNIEGFLTPDEYTNGLPRQEHSVTNEIYRLIYNDVWERWYKGLTVNNTDNDLPGEYWDDQDLVRFVIRKNYFPKTYPVVFCDEAQDFTRIELNCILNLSLFSHRKTFSHDTTKIPFAFAGDPFQTLNPTGFRWEATKASFVEQFINSHSFSKKNSIPEMNFCELKNNYRSQQNIVGFCNCVQGVRAYVLDENFTPQNPWFQSVNAFPAAYYDEKNKNFWDWVKDRQDVVFIVPCNEGEEEQYWENNEYLHDNVEKNDVMSVVAIKGLEYKNIVVYGFGKDTKSRTISNLWIHDSHPKLDDKISLEYFLNKLYVSVSRAQQRLLVVDSMNAFDNFWKIFEESQDANIRLKSGPLESYITFLGIGDNSLLSDKTGNIKEHAEQLKKDGIQTENPKLLYAAAEKFNTLGKKIEKNECLCLAAFYSKDYEKAITLNDNADYTFKHQCYWLLGTKSYLEKILTDIDAGNITDFKATIEFQLLKHCFNPSKDIARVLQEIYCAYSDKAEKLFETEKSVNAWQTLVVETLKDLMAVSKNMLKDKNALWENIVKLEELELCTDCELLCRLAASMEKWSEVIKYFEKNSKELKQNSELQKYYFEAQKKTTPVPQQIRNAYNKKAYQDVLDIYENREDGIVLSIQEEQMVSIAFVMTKHDFSLLENVMRRECPDIKFQEALCDLQLSKREKELVQKYIFQSNLAACNWENVKKSSLMRGYKKKKTAEAAEEDFVCLLAFVDPEKLQKDAKGRTIQDFTEYLKWFVEKSNKNFVRSHFIEIGCAFEKLNNIKAAQYFYSQVIKNLNGKDVRLVKLRQIVCHERHAKIIENPKDRDLQLRKAKELRTELKIGNVPIGSPEIPEYMCGNDPWFCEKINVANNIEDSSEISEYEPVVLKEENETPKEQTVDVPIVENTESLASKPIEKETTEITVQDEAEKENAKEPQHPCNHAREVVFKSDFFDSTQSKVIDIKVGDWEVTRYFNTGIINFEHSLDGYTISISNNQKVVPGEGLNSVELENGLWNMWSGRIELDIRQYPRIRFVLHDRKIIVEFEI